MDTAVFEKDEFEVQDIDALGAFNEKFSTPNYRTIDDFQLTDKQFAKLWQSVLGLMLQQRIHNSDDLCMCLNTIRILTRDKTAVNRVVKNEEINVLLRLSNLVPSENEYPSKNFSQEELYKVQEEACKCLSNLMFQSTVAQPVCCTAEHTKSVLKTLAEESEKFPHTLLISYLKLLFLISALNDKTRSVAVDECDALTVMLKLLNSDSNKDKTLAPTMQREMVELTVEVLKLLYCFCVSITGTGGCGAKAGEGCLYPTPKDAPPCGLNPKIKEDLNALVNKMRLLLSATAHTHQHTQLMHSHCINLLVSVPTCVLPALTPRTSGGGAGSSLWWGSSKKVPTFRGADMTAIIHILAFLHARLNAPGQQTSDSLTPVLTLLISACESNRVLRRFVRMRIMPPLKDVMQRPEEGCSIRNRLVRLMTSPLIELKQLSANLLFVLSNHSVERLIKYSGYGNCAGLLASLGLMAGGAKKGNTEESESEDSETEEYEKVKHMVNPVTGCYEPVRPNPMDDMTEEQKEYEANKLVNALDKLIRDGDIKPCGIGPDGRPQALEHVLQLQDSKVNPSWCAKIKNLDSDEESD